MADETVPASTYSARVIDAMIAVLQGASSPEIMQAQALLLRRLALTGDVVPSRIQAPKNITEIGGYINLLETLQQPVLRSQVLASILGVAGPNPAPGWLPTAPVLFYSIRPNDRPSGHGQAAIPLQYWIRSDFASAFDGALKDIHDRGCQLPIRSQPPALPSVTGSPPEDLLRYIGRTLSLWPAAALNDPDNDVLAVARLTAGGPLQVVARQLDAAAPSAGLVVANDWTAWECTAAACQETQGANRLYLPLAPFLSASGWYQPAPPPPNSLVKPGSWADWVNISGLVSGVTKYEDELKLLYSDAQIVASSLREHLLWVWDGTAFVKPS